MTRDASPRVFISYAHDSQDHKDLVREFATFLRVEVGIDAHLDQWHDGPRRDWAAWAGQHLQTADFIIVIASPAYRRRANGQAPPDEGRGSQYEAAIIRNNLTRNLPEETQRVLPVILPGGSVDDIPEFLCGYSTSHYRIEKFTTEGVEELRRAISGEPLYVLPVLGPYAPPGSREDKGVKTGKPLVDRDGTSAGDGQLAITGDHGTTPRADTGRDGVIPPPGPGAGGGAHRKPRGAPRTHPLWIIGAVAVLLGGG